MLEACVCLLYPILSTKRLLHMLSIVLSAWDECCPLGVLRPLYQTTHSARWSSYVRILPTLLGIGQTDDEGCLMHRLGRREIYNMQTSQSQLWNLHE